MKTKLVITAAALITLAGASCSSTTGGTASVKPYPFDDCIITDNTLGSMGPPITKVYDGQEVKFCCEPCIAKFENNPDRYLARLQ